MKDKSKWIINKKQRKRIKEGVLTKFSDEQKKELQKLAKRIERELNKK